MDSLDWTVWTEKWGKKVVKQNEQLKRLWEFGMQTDVLPHNVLDITVVEKKKMFG